MHEPGHSDVESAEALAAISIGEDASEEPLADAGRAENEVVRVDKFRITTAIEGRTVRAGRG